MELKESSKKLKEKLEIGPSKEQLQLLVVSEGW
jgi:hypothetical protein